MSYQPYDILYTDLLELAQTGWTTETRYTTVSGYLLTFYDANKLETEVTESGINSWISENWSTIENQAYGTFATTPLSYAHYEHQETQGTDGGTNNTGSWLTRELNTTVSQYGGGISRTGDVIEVSSGTYRMTGRSMVYGVDAHQCRLYDTTNSETLLWGNPAFSTNVDPGGDYGYDTESTLDGIVVVSGTVDVELQHYMQTQRSLYGWGIARNIGTEIFARLTIVRLK